MSHYKHQWWRTGRLRRRNRSLQSLLGRLMGFLDRWPALTPQQRLAATPEWRALTEEARRLAATRNGGA